MAISSGVAHVYPHVGGQGARSKSAHQLERPVGNAQCFRSRMVPGNPRSINSHCPMVLWMINQPEIAGDFPLLFTTI